MRSRLIRFLSTPLTENTFRALCYLGGGLVGYLNMRLLAKTLSFK